MTSVTVIVSIFFVIGITVGVITVIAMSVLRRDRRDRRDGPDDWPGHGPDGPDEQPPDLDWDAPEPKRDPWWQARDGE